MLGSVWLLVTERNSKQLRLARASSDGFDAVSDLLERKRALGPQFTSCVACASASGSSSSSSSSSSSGSGSSIVVVVVVVVVVVI